MVDSSWVRIVAINQTSLRKLNNLYGDWTFGSLILYKVTWYNGTNITCELAKLGLNSRSTTYCVILKKSFNICDLGFLIWWSRTFIADYRRQGTWKYLTQNKLVSTNSPSAGYSTTDIKKNLSGYIFYHGLEYMTTPIMELAGMGWKAKETLQGYPERTSSENQV